MAQLRPRKGTRRELISAIGESEKSGNDERGNQQYPKRGLGDEDKAAGIPPGIEGEEGADAIVVGPVEQDVAQSGDECSEIDPLPTDRLRLKPRWGSGFSGWGGQSSLGAAMFDPAVIEPGGAHGCGGNEGHRNESVGDAAMMFEAFDGASESPDDVEVGGFSGEDCGQRGVGSFAIKTGAADAGAG